MPKFNAAFWKWFGDSKVVDENGQPLVVYHGSKSPWIASFDPKLSGTGLAGSGLHVPAVYFSSDKDNAGYYAETSRRSKADLEEIQVVGDDRIGYTAFVSDRRGNILFGAGSFRTEAQAEEQMKIEASLYNAAIQSKKDTWITPVYLSLQNPKVYKGTFGARSVSEAVAQAKQEGHDGVIFYDVLDGYRYGNTYVVFKRRNIKHAFENDGTWDADDPAIRSNPEPELFWGRAGAGVLLHCADDDTYLLTLRSDSVEQPGTWGIPGGSCSGEGFYSGAEGRVVDENQAWDCAVRETLEELGWFPERIGAVHPVVFTRGNFRYTTFVVEVDAVEKVNSAEAIELNWENDDAAWFSPANLRRKHAKLHFGVQFVLDELGVVHA